MVYKALYTLSINQIATINETVHIVRNLFYNPTYIVSVCL